MNTEQQNQLKNQNNQLERYFGENEARSTMSNYLIIQSQQLIHTHYYLIVCYYILVIIFIYVLFTSKLGSTQNMYIKGTIITSFICLPYILWYIEIMIYSIITFIYDYYYGNIYTKSKY